MNLGTHYELGRHWREIVIELDRPERAAETLREFRALLETRQRVIDAAGDQAKALRDASDAADKIAAYLTEQKRAPEAVEFTKRRDEWKQELGARFANDPTVIVNRLSTATDRCWKLLNEFRNASPAQKPATFTEIEKQVRESRTYLAEQRTHLSDYDSERCRGGFEYVLGAALVEAQRYTEAEPPLRAAIEARNAVVTNAKDANDAIQKRWDAADPLLKLGLAVYKQGRVEEGLKLRREGAEARETIARESPSPGRLRDSGGAWRDLSELLDAPDRTAERIAALQKSVELTRDGLKLAKSTTASPESELVKYRSAAGWALLNLGVRQREAKHLAEAEATLREGLAISMENVAAVAPDAEPDRTRQLSNIRYDLAKTLLALGRADEARVQKEAMDAEVHAFEDKAGHPMPQFDEARHRLEELRTILGKPPGK
jgi:tetratricopeptide (TPR) repeat protein